MPDERAFRNAVNLARRGEMKAARRILKDLIENREDDEQAWVWLAATYASDDTRLRILQAANLRYPQGELVNKALQLLQRRIEQREMRMVATEKSAPQLEFPVEPPPENFIPARTVPPQPEEGRTGVGAGIPATRPGPSAIEEEAELAEPTRAPAQGNDLWKLALAISVVVLTILTAYLWTQLR